ncbi:hypothetical protein ACFYOG_31090 [Streptomyces sp. NPDC007818]|uniref:hypothetical protein n=1 Tax=Streptomyces sp. NPDC007818 TaxID=3364780 RepID=UPI0036CC2297
MCQPATDAIRIVEVLRALADPVRLEIVRLAVTAPRGGRHLDHRPGQLRRDDLDALFPGPLDSVLNGARRPRPPSGD